MNHDQSPLRLSFNGPLEWPMMLAYFGSRAIPGVERVGADSYRRTIVIDGRPGAIELTSGGTDHLLLRVCRSHADRSSAIVQRARRIFSLDAPVREAVQALSRDPVIGGLVAARPGLRVPGTWDPFETGVRAIIGQQISVAGANTIIGRLVAQVGEPADMQARGLTHTFPSARVLADADLSHLGVPRTRAAAIQSFARSVADGQVRLDGAMSLGELTRAITAIRGLGPWTAHYIALRLGERDAFPSADLGLRRSLARISPQAAASLVDVAAAWSPWRATAAVHLWHA